MEAGGDVLPAAPRRLPRGEVTGVLVLAVLIGLVVSVNPRDTPVTRVRPSDGGICRAPAPGIG